MPGSTLAPFRDIIERLKEVPELSMITIETIIAEIGTDMSPSPTASDSRALYLLGRAHSAPPRECRQPPFDPDREVRSLAQQLKHVLVQAAWAAARKKSSYLPAQFLRLKARRGSKKAVIAVAASDPDDRMKQASSFYRGRNMRLCIGDRRQVLPSLKIIGQQGST